MAARRRGSIADRIIEESVQINEGLMQLDAQDPDSEDELPKEAKEAFLMREIQKKDEKIKELSGDQEELLSQIEDFEQENLRYARETEHLRHTINELEAKLSSLKNENAELAAGQDGALKSREISFPDLDVSDLSKELKVTSQVYARGVVTHAVAERSYELMREMMFYLEQAASVKRIREGEFWNIAIWFMYATFRELREDASFTAMVDELKNNRESSEVLLQFCSILLAHLGIDSL